ncbi:MAG: hypothetical protein M3Y86_04025 [Verrucomicrobiota bacterium]|nr:hypothetical protein [Verrucomicrobiota bacterium]
MSGQVEEIAQVIRALPRPEIEELRDWIEGFLEDQLELTEEFAASIIRGRDDIAAGKVRVRQPE